jgi:hypothetical protein
LRHFLLVTVCGVTVERVLKLFRIFRLLRAVMG